MNFKEALHDVRLFKPSFGDLESWHSWEVCTQVFFGEPIDMEKDGTLLKDCAGLDEQPKEKYRECYIIAGRRSGKSKISATIAVYLATFKDWSKILTPGEKGYVFIVANDKRQARIIKDYVSGILNSVPSFKKLISKELTEEIELKNKISILIKTCNYRTLRSYTLIACIMEEIAFWRSEDSANPDKEIVAAVKPSLATIPDSVLIGISTPYSRRGLLFEMWKKHFGKSGGPLIWKAKTEIMNPTINREIIKQDFVDDPQAALSEWEAEWRSDIEALIPQELVESATIPNRFELQRNGDEGFKYYAFADPSGGRQDSFTLGIAHREQREDSDFSILILDSLLEQKPPFRPEEVVARFCEHLEGYEIDEVVMDRYSGEWAKNSFERNGIMVKESELSKSEIYLEFLPLISNGRVELLDNKKLAVQLSSLERKTRAGGKDLVDVFFGHDDLANSACGALLRAEREGGKASLADAIEWI